MASTINFYRMQKLSRYVEIENPQTSQKQFRLSNLKRKKKAK